MNSRLKETFDMIHADENLKSSTKKYIIRKTKNYNRYRFFLKNKLAPALICLSFLVCCIAGYRFYFTSTSVISIDINPSVELDINCFGRVISVVSYNDDGSELKKSTNVRFLDYKDALIRILNDKDISELLTQDEILSVVVIADKKQREEMLSNIELCTLGYKKAFCRSASSEDVAGAHEHGLSYGKYYTFLELQELNPDITVEEIKGMTMKEIRNLIHELSSDSYDTIPDENCMENGHSGGNTGNGFGNGHGNGSKRGYNKNKCPNK